jgi:hypothetical protein
MGNLNYFHQLHSRILTIVYDRIIGILDFIRSPGLKN